MANTTGSVLNVSVSVTLTLIPSGKILKGLCMNRSNPRATLTNGVRVRVRARVRVRVRAKSAVRVARIVIRRLQLWLQYQSTWLQ